ncbi:hypothetical protein [Paenibacillus monticola]|uniref:Uncharacterized protein n=1 Tax=Paenibacillus monticola TaxID=2666075 RepID=A0A7X2H9V2_9BACL|nr:hypothetical protein [Paenibacillus monticola]MRN56204.1 hypothetical protein [Paenibacillus monticola]
MCDGKLAINPSTTIYDYSLDVIKGISCILMIIAHVPLKAILFTETTGFTYFPWMFAFLAGIFAYKCNNIFNLIGSLAAGLLLALSLMGLNIFFSP